jgi:hypothetical protein
MELLEDAVSLNGQLHRAVLTELYWEPSVAEAHIRVTVHHLEARRLQDLIGLSNYVVVKPTVSAPDVADAMTHALDRDRSSHDLTIQVSADAGRVHLSRTVCTPHDRRMTVRTVWGAPGTLSTEDDIPILGWTGDR